MTKILNLDELETSFEKIIVVKGVKYAMAPFSVEDFINQMKELEEASEKEMSGVDIYELSLKMIQRAFPTLEAAVLRKLNTFQVDAIYNFLKANSEEEVRQAVEGNVSGEASS